LSSVKVKLTGRDTEEPVVEEKPLHKKNPEIGNKRLVYASEFIMEQDDVASFGDNEEVSWPLQSSPQ
jgi:glutamyl-tRNA synthetase